MKYYRFLLASYAIACVYAAGCSGGSTPVEVEGPGPGADETPVPSPGGGNTPPVNGTGSSGVGSSGNGSSGNGSSGTASGGTSSSSGGACTTCSDLLAGNASGTYCPGSDTLYVAFGMCACSSCSADCVELCQDSMPPSALCLQCAACATQISDCQADQ